MQPRLILALFVGLAIAAAPVAGWSDQKSTRDYRQKYRFDADFFTAAIPLWKEVLAPYAGKPDLSYLEVGTFQGRSFLWVVENVMTHPSSKLTAIDIVISKNFLDNVKLSGAAERVTTLEGRSQDMLRTLPQDSFDIIYIDGSHRGDDVLIDAALAWGLLKVGGLLIFDDYEWEMTFPDELRPTLAVDTFITLFRSRLDLVHRGHQLIVRRKDTPCVFPPDQFGPDRFCSPIGAYVYDWKRKVVLDPRSRKEVPLSNPELAVVRRLILDIRVGQIDVDANQMLRKDPSYESLSRKLGLDAHPDAGAGESNGSGTP